MEEKNSALPELPSGDAQERSHDAQCQDGVFYLVQRDANRKGADRRPLFLGVVGKVIRTQAGYRFISCISSHKNGRKVRGSLIDAIPPWAQTLAEKKGFADLLSAPELHAASRAAVAKAEGRAQ